MQYKYYPYSCVRIETAIRRMLDAKNVPFYLRSLECVDPDRYRTDKIIMVRHILWMLKRLQTFEGTDAHAVAKRGRWIGWAYAYCEWMGLLTQPQVRRVARLDSDTDSV